MRYCKYLSSESGANLSRYALVEKRNGVPWATLPDAGPAGGPFGPHPWRPPRPYARCQLRTGSALRTATAPAGHPIEDPLRRPQLPRSRRRAWQRSPQRSPCSSSNRRRRCSPPRASSASPPSPRASTTRASSASSSPAAATRSDPTRMFAPTFAAMSASTTSPPATSRSPTASGRAAKALTPSAPSALSCPTRSTPQAARPVTVITRLNGVVKQQGSTRDLIFPIAELLRYITATMTLEPGDLIPTGTPAGVGAVKPGDRIQIEIDGLGILENEFAAE